MLKMFRMFGFVSHLTFEFFHIIISAHSSHLSLLFIFECCEGAMFYERSLLYLIRVLVSRLTLQSKAQFLFVYFPIAVL
jgi:hypothetical protein